MDFELNQLASWISQIDHRSKKRKKMSGKTHIHESNEKIRALSDIELPAKLLDYFLRSNKSNINQSKLNRKSEISSFKSLCTLCINPAISL